ncbi:terminase large subunit [uncultured Mediterranean phage uvMED]|nr:terminase large subunit [uncultured Mediterranean phage uvMED]
MGLAQLQKDLKQVKPLILAKSGHVTEAVYGVVDRVDIVDGKQVPHFVRRWKGTIGNMRPTDEEPTIYCIEKLEPMLLKHKKYKCMFGGRAGTKSIFGSDAMIGDVTSFGSKVFVLRERMKSLKNSIYSTINGRISTLDVAGFTPVPSHWEIRKDNGGLFTFGGMANIIDFKGSFEYKFVLLEECARTSQETLDVIGPTLRGVDGSEIWMIWNAESATDPMSTNFIIPFEEELTRSGYYEDDYHIVIKVGYEDNPWFKHDESLRDELAKDKEKVKDGRMSKARYNWIWNGAFNDDVENSIIEADWFDACVDAHKKIANLKPQGQKVASHDPADIGEDNKPILIRHGNVFVAGKEIFAENGNRAFDDACKFALSHNVNKFVWDSDGMGALLRDQAETNFKGTGIETFMYKGSSSVALPEATYKGQAHEINDQRKNKEVFKNRRAQNYISLAERMFKTYQVIEKGFMYDADELISFSSDIECLQKLRSELCQMPLKNNTATIELYSKAEMKKGIRLSDGTVRKLPSPGCADCVKQSYDHSLTIEQVEWIQEDLSSGY